ncbi:hypothetical protein CYMTET_22639 [Cymbomonas tetramitiformis]|uniref:Uncharacterized protein n=1 Tax=Cymbomonas tetramitiformis TaxID=36881 RepID=A0AAE0KTV9_9CHLO|nr:hypothetical protein CYMTET_30477 [Cymbomonas tetramitiformis]KAK3268883.1 hypothetical protein CYMTET_22639 [Cymbomonas tetramitiformis]
MGSGGTEVKQSESSVDDESKYPVGYFDESDDSSVEEGGHLASPHFLQTLLERGSPLDKGFQGESQDSGGVLDPSLEARIFTAARVFCGHGAYESFEGGGAQEDFDGGAYEEYGCEHNYYSDDY